MDPILFRGIERILIVLGAILFGYLGYRLFIRGISSGDGNLKVHSQFLRIILSGTGPGLFFMAFGAIILIVMIVWGSVSVTEQTTTTTRTETAAQPPAPKQPRSTPTESARKPDEKGESAIPEATRPGDSSVIQETKHERKAKAAAKK